MLGFRNHLGPLLWGPNSKYCRIWAVYVYWVPYFNTLSYTDENVRRQRPGAISGSFVCGPAAGFICRTLLYDFFQKLGPIVVYGDLHWGWSFRFGISLVHEFRTP